MLTRAKIVGVTAVLALGASTADAALFHFTGTIANHNDVIYVQFSAAGATNVRVWTDSFQNAVNFDPITALWNTDTGALIDENDDDDNVNPATQTYFDSGFTLPSLAAGNYTFTITPFANFVAGNNLSNPGFAYAGDAPISLSNWCQPASHCNMGTYWSVWLDGVTEATAPSASVPEPGSLLLMGLGLASAGFARRRRKNV